MAKSADAADLKSAGPKGLWGFKSPSGHHRLPIKTAGKRAGRPEWSITESAAYKSLVIHMVILWYSSDLSNSVHSPKKS